MFSKIAASSDFIYGSTVGELAPAAAHRVVATAYPRSAPRIVRKPEPRVESVAARVERFRTVQLERFGSYMPGI